ncbi:MAG: YfhO family protein [candidate division WOR-3 bacterium]|nr:YfhO family protein [candidate division WOR-3 bacterium]
MKNLEILIVSIIPIFLLFKALLGNLLIMTDAITDGIYLYEFIRKEILSGSFPFWNPYIFYGMPTIPTLQFGFYPFFLLLIILPAKFFLNYWIIFHLIIAGIGMFILVNRILSDKVIALFSAVSFMLSGIFFGYLYSGHLGKFAIVSILPFYFLYLREIFINPSFKNALLLSLFTSLISLNAHIQMIYYLVLFTFFYVLYESYFVFKENNKKLIRVFSLGIFSLLLSILIFFGQFLPIYDYTINYSQRGQIESYEFATTWSLGWQDFISSFIGGFSGFSLEDTNYSFYWGPNAFKINSEYFGIVVFLLFILSFLNKIENRLRNFLIFSFVFFSIISLGGSTFLYKIIWTVLPAYQKFRAPSMAFYLCVFSAILISAITLKNLKENPRVYTKLLFLIPISLLIFWLFSSESLINGIFNNPIDKAQIVLYEIDKIRFSIFMTFLFSTLASVLILSHINNWISHRNLVLFLSIISGIDLYLISKNFIRYVDNEEHIFKSDSVVMFLKNQKGYFNVFPFAYRTDDNYFTLKEIRTIGGHHGVQPHRLFSIIGAENRLMLNPATTTEILKNPKLSDVLSIRFVITQKLPEVSDEPIVKLFQEYVRNYKKVYDDGIYEIYENPNYYPIFYLASSYKVSNNPISDVRNYQGKLIFESEPVEKINLDKINGNIEVMNLSENYAKLKVDLENPAYLVFSNNYHKQWKAFVNGKEKKIYIVNYLQMAIALDKGSHVVVFKYEPKLEISSLIISIFTFVVLVFSILLFSLRRK